MSWGRLRIRSAIASDIVGYVIDSYHMLGCDVDTFRCFNRTLKRAGRSHPDIVALVPGIQWGFGWII